MNPPAKKNEAYQPTMAEQIANIITHGVRRITPLSLNSVIEFYFLMCSLRKLSWGQKSMISLWESRKLSRNFQNGDGRMLEVKLRRS